ncbi:MAG: hypothetical protein OEY07_13940, partial [Gammaproteobacteria bacterium]|nr:hypothetical protein [Gammaproteobacteria bacterium]
YDEYRAERTLPLLSGVEDSLELTRWVSQYELTIQQEVKKEGCCALKLTARGGDYVSAKLQYFPDRWREYTGLRLDIYIPDPEPVLIGISIYNDPRNENRYVWPGLAMHRYPVKPGWNTLELAYAAQINRPSTAMAPIRGVIVFIEKPRIGQTIYIDNVRLVK